MPSLRITRFGGINTEIAARNSRKDVAQIAHNCLLWDGSLRPLAKWASLNVVGYDCYSVDIASDDTTILLNAMKDALFLDDEVFPASTVVGLASAPYGPVLSNIGYANKLNPARTSYEVGVPPVKLSVLTTVTYARQYLSNKAVNRLYAVSVVRYNGSGKEESSLTLLPNQNPQIVIYEGDTATIHIVLADGALRERSTLRLYRSISGLDTANAIVNDLDTEWFLVTEFNTPTQTGLSANYDHIDGGSVTNIPMDVFLASRFAPPAPITFSALTVAESGWLVATAKDGRIAISERYLYHAWPTENYARLPETITDCIAHYDTVYIGTKDKPYAMALAAGEALGLQLAPIPFPASYECLAGSMDTTANGAMYATNAGIVSLSKQGMELITSGVASGVRSLYEAHYLDETTTPHSDKCKPLNFRDTKYGAYFNGKYFGFCQILRDDAKYLDLGYLFDTASTLDGEHPLQKLVTFDAPKGTVLSHTVGSSGLDILVGIPNPDIGVDALIKNFVYSMPFPNTKKGGKYNTAPKMCYQWKSKKFVFPGNMTMAAAKVVHDCDGSLRLKVFVDCCCRYEVEVKDCKPFRLPPSMQGVEWEVEVTGTATIHEIHLASSIRELLEDEQGNAQ